MRQQRSDTPPDERTDPVHQVMGPVPGGKSGAESSSRVHRGARQRSDGHDVEGDGPGRGQTMPREGRGHVEEDGRRGNAYALLRLSGPGDTRIHPPSSRQG